ncbi:MAG: ammonium transporter [Candidatus Schekmanbacteria bacterium]|nr:ammonium transporter [Candidatus Schekmanbacteria bacterium]
MTDPIMASPPIDPGSTAWMLVSSALVLLMVPGLALFYGGLVRRKNVMTTMLHSFAAMGVVGVQWILFGYMLAFGPSVGGVIGWDPSLLALHGLPYTQNFADKAIPELVFVMFQGKFAIITPALISGAIAERMKFSAYVVFLVLWSTIIYCPLAHWVWASGGWLFEYGVLDFAGGTVVHIASGVSALVLAMLLGARRDYRPGRTAILPHNLPLTLTGAGLLWFGWFGFNAGSAVAADHPVAGYVAGLAFTTTQTAAATGALTWMLIEWWFHSRPTSLGLASGILAGLVAITPAAGHVSPAAALVFGAVAAVCCFMAVQMKPRFAYDDSLDAFGIHGIGGMVGALLTGVFCFIPVVGLVSGGGAGQLGKQLVGVLSSIVFVSLGTLAIGLVLKHSIGLRATDEQERDGLDISIHGERAYHQVIAS